MYKNPQTFSMMKDRGKKSNIHNNGYLNNSWACSTRVQMQTSLNTVFKNGNFFVVVVTGSNILFSRDA